MPDITLDNKYENILKDKKYRSKIMKYNKNTNNNKSMNDYYFTIDEIINLSLNKYPWMIKLNF